MSNLEDALVEVRRMTGQVKQQICVRAEGPALYYVTSDGQSVVPIDIGIVKDQFDEDAADAGHREQLICRALIKHALAMMNGEDVA